MLHNNKCEEEVGNNETWHVFSVALCSDIGFIVKCTIGVLWWAAFDDHKRNQSLLWWVCWWSDGPFFSLPLLIMIKVGSNVLPWEFLSLYRHLVSGDWTAARGFVPLYGRHLYSVICPCRDTLPLCLHSACDVISSFPCQEWGCCLSLSQPVH